MIELDLVGVRGLGLDGPGAVPAARALLVDLLGNAGSGEAEVIVVGVSLLDELSPATAPFPGLDVVPDVDAALGRLEVELVHRTRVLDVDGDETDDFAAFVAANPTEPLPAVILVAKDLSGGALVRLEAILTAGPRLGIGALVLKRFPSLTTLAVAADGTVDASPLRGRSVSCMLPIYRRGGTRGHGTVGRGSRSQG